MKYMKSYISGIVLLCSAIFLSGCTEDKDTVAPTPASDLKVSVRIGERNTVSRAEVGSDQSLHEDVIGTLDLFIFDGSEDLLTHYTLNDCISGITYILENGSAWKNKYVPDGTYPVYAIANYDGDLSQIRTLDGLKQLSSSDKNIYKVYDPEGNPDKLFLMDGSGTLNMPNAADDNAVLINMQLRRAAAKIQVNISTGGLEALGFEPAGNYSWKLVNYASNTHVLADGIPPSVERQTADGYSAWDGDGNAEILAYSYANDWSSAPLEYETALIINVPGTLSKEDGDYETISNNYYKIPVRDSREQYIERNYIYTVNAKLNSLGSYSEIENSDYELDYAVEKWGEWNIDVEVPELRYLTVSPTSLVLRDEERNSEVYYYSSHDVEIVDIDVYYYDKNGNKISVAADGGDLRLSDPKNGNVLLYSPVPENLGVRYIHYTIRHADSPAYNERVKITQYPLEYIQFIEGWYSTRRLEDNIRDNIATTATKTWCGWELGQTPHVTQMTWQDGPGSSNNTFRSKISENGVMRYYTDVSSGIGSNRRYTMQRSSGTIAANLSNNRMYVVQITSTSDKYTVDYPVCSKHPEIGIIVDPSEANNNVVSPAFMLASQLGFISSSIPENTSGRAFVESHCRTYREVAQDGTVYDDWRLPTKAEIKIIEEYQYKEGVVMDLVLSARNYYCADLSLVSLDRYSYTGNYVRCIRDMSPDEIKALEKE